MKVETLKDLTVQNIDEIYIVNSPRGRKFTMENRKYMGLTFCKSGKITYFQNGKEFVSCETSAVILPMGASYTLYGNKNGEFPLINFYCTGFEFEEITVIPLRNPESYIKQFEKMYSLFPHKQNRLSVLSNFYSMINNLSKEGSAQNCLLSPALDYIEKNYSDVNISNLSLSKLCNISEVYFRKTFTLAKGMSPKQYLIEIRLERSKQLLTENKLSIGEIAEQCGFSSVYHFCRIFKQKIGITPTEYRNQNIKYGI